MKKNDLVAAVLAALTLCTVSGAADQQPSDGPSRATTAQPPQGRGGGGGRGGAQPLNLTDRAGFESIFDGTMHNWDGDPAFWKVENGALVGETTTANPLKENTFLIWRGDEPADFELKVEVRMSSTNSGIQFRSQHVPAGTTQGNNVVSGKWVMKGYQADIDFDNRYTGMIYEERGRGIVMQRGQAVYLGADGTRKVIANLQRNADELKALIKPGDWNYVHIIARGNTLMNIVNGELMAVVIDEDVKARAMKGLIGFQVHVGPPMRVEFRNIYLKKL